MLKPMLTKFLYSQSIKQAMNIVQQIYIAPFHYGNWRAKDIDQSAAACDVLPSSVLYYDILYCLCQQCGSAGDIRLIAIYWMQGF